jgi:hypothetical protein
LLTVLETCFIGLLCIYVGFCTVKIVLHCTLGINSEKEYSGKFAMAWNVILSRFLEKIINVQIIWLKWEVLKEKG